MKDSDERELLNANGEENLFSVCCFWTWLFDRRNGWWIC